MFVSKTFFKCVTMHLHGQIVSPYLLQNLSCTHVLNT